MPNGVAKMVPLSASAFLPAISEEDLVEHAGEFAVFSGGRLVGFHKTNSEALEAAATRFERLGFTISQVRRGG
ncbi:MAG: hypothetical protein GC152_07230 [Alphaproteobacteria bacterium]|nr:hypothetical protein [Alphaproteobacteria bacterium]